MINEVIISRLDEIIGEYNTPFLNYLIYSYNLNLNDCEIIINHLKDDINSNKVLSDNIVLTIQEYFNNKIIEIEKQKKLNYLSDLISKDNEFYIKFLKRYELSDEEIDLIYNKICEKVSDENINEFEIKRYLEYYFSNYLKQTSYIKDLKLIAGKNYDTLIINNAKRKYPILTEKDIIQIISKIHGDIIDAKEFKNGIKNEFLTRCMKKSERKKAMAKNNLKELIEGKGDSFSMLVNFKNLSSHDGEIVVKRIEQDIINGLIQPEKVNGLFLTNCFNEYIENEGH